LACGPAAQAACKELIRRMPGLAGEERKIETSGLIARLRAGREGQEGMAAFLERRRPSWRPGDADGGR
jgi:methylglutaconyl-CoA hydratase